MSTVPLSETAVTAPRFSIVIPYKQRVRNARLVFESLARQTLPASEFEVVLGVMENDPEFTQLCRDYQDRLTVVSVATAQRWQVGRARNLALRAASGTVVVLLDVDMVVPSTFLENLWEKHFSRGERQCVVGQMLDYDNNATDVAAVEVKPYAHYAELLAGLDAEGPGPADARLRTEHVIPWAFAWTALIALPRAAVLEEGLFFDLNFHGYGVEDLEWAYRVSLAGLPILMKEDVFGIHLPHPRNVAANQETEKANYQYFLRKWPSVEVELASAFGDFRANEELGDHRRRTASALGRPDARLATLRGRQGGVDTLVLGAVLEPDGEVGADSAPAFDGPVEILPLTGLALPHGSGEVERVVVLEIVDQLGDDYRDLVLAEAERVSAGAVLRSLPV